MEDQIIYKIIIVGNSKSISGLYFYIKLDESKELIRISKIDTIMNNDIKYNIYEYNCNIPFNEYFRFSHNYNYYYIYKENINNRVNEILGYKYCSPQKYGYEYSCNQNKNFNGYDLKFFVTILTKPTKYPEFLHSILSEFLTINCLPQDLKIPIINTYIKV